MGAVRTNASGTAAEQIHHSGVSEACEITATKILDGHLYQEQIQGVRRYDIDNF